MSEVVEGGSMSLVMMILASIVIIIIGLIFSKILVGP